MMKNNDELYKFIHPLDNDKISQFNGEDLLHLIVLLNDYYLEMRNSLGFDDSVSFGVEIEFEKSNTTKILTELDKKISNKNWKLCHDGSLDDGGEYDSPIMYDKEEYWNELRFVCENLTNYSTILDSAGGHVHVGTHVLGQNKKHWMNFILLWSIYENIIFRFGYGEYLTPRKTLKDYAPAMSNIFKRDYNVLTEDKGCKVREIIEQLNHDGYQAVNFEHITKTFKDFGQNNTIEFRCPNGTLNPIVWQNNVNLFVKLLEYVKSPNFDRHTILNRKKNNLCLMGDLIWYSDIYLDQAVEFADMLFNNNLDKLYFLRQYLKNYETNLSGESRVLAKKFTV